MSDISDDALLDIIGHDECSLTEAKDAARAALDARRERDEVRRMLRDLLAVVHRDGGDYTMAVGIAASTRDAMQTVPTTVAALGEASERIAELEAALREAAFMLQEHHGYECGSPCRVARAFMARARALLDDGK